MWLHKTMTKQIKPCCCLSDIIHQEKLDTIGRKTICNNFIAGSDKCKQVHYIHTEVRGHPFKLADLAI